MKTYTESLSCRKEKWYTWTVLLRLVFLDNEYLSEASQHYWQYPILVTLHGKARSSRPEVFRKKIPCFGKFRKPKLFSCEFCEIFQNTFFHIAPQVAASAKLKAEAADRRCSVKKVFLEILLNSHENTSARASFLQPYECNFIKIESLTLAFSCEVCEHLFTERIRWLLL